jgi:hypothetical protein
VVAAVVARSRRAGAVLAYLRERREAIPQELQAEAEERLAVDTCLDIVCPLCRQATTWRCAEVNRAGEVVKDAKDKPKLINAPHRERYDARLAQIRGAG